MKIKALFLSVVIPLLFIIQSCATNPVTGKKDFMLVSKQQEIAMGEQADPEIVSFFGLYEDEQLQRFIDEKGQEMVEISHRPDLDYEFKIVDSPVVNAFAVPGGYVYFTRGIMAHFTNEAEFAGVLGHEIGHIAARHSAKQYSRAMMAELGLVVGSVVSEEIAMFSDLARTGVGILFLKFGRDAERQSDRLGVEYSSKVGYDAHQMANFFTTLDRMRQQSGQTVPEFLSTHPDPSNRLERVNELADKLQNKLNLTDPQVNREAYLQMIDGIVYGEDPRQGYVEEGAFYHPTLEFAFSIPGNWQLQNTPQQVQMAPSDGSALISLTISPANDLQAAAKDVMEKYQLSAIRSDRINVNGLDAYAILAQQQLQQQQELQLLVYLIQHQNNIYNFIGVTTATEFNKYSRTFDRTLGSFSRLTNTQKLNVSPERIRVIRTNSSGSLQQILQRNDIPEDRLQELSRINGMPLDATVSSGTLLKIVSR